MPHWPIIWHLLYRSLLRDSAEIKYSRTKNRIQYDTDRQGDIPDDAPPDYGTLRQNRGQVESYEPADGRP